MRGEGYACDANEVLYARAAVAGPWPPLVAKLLVLNTAPRHTNENPGEALFNVRGGQHEPAAGEKKTAASSSSSSLFVAEQRVLRGAGARPQLGRPPHTQNSGQGGRRGGGTG